MSEIILIDEDIGNIDQKETTQTLSHERLHDLVTLFCGDCLQAMRELADDCIDSVVTDPPYELGFMGKKWDKKGISFQVSLWAEVFRVLKPGGHILVMGGTRTYHRMVCAIEDAGFEIRDTLMWVYGQGFPKSQNVSKMIDKAAGVEREKVGQGRSGKRECYNGQNAGRSKDFLAGDYDVTAPVTPEAVQWDGWGTGLKPAHEMICLARKPLSEKTVVANVLTWGTGALNIGGCKVGSDARTYDLKGGENLNKLSRVGAGDSEEAKGLGAYGVGAKQASIGEVTVNGRWPPNLIHDGSSEVIEAFPETDGKGLGHQGVKPYNDSGSAARFFSDCPYTDGDDIPIKQWLLYCAKASKKDRNGSKHPTIKPIRLMQWLCRLVTPPGGCVLDPFAGSGTTGAAAVREGFQAILCENDPESQNDIRRRFDIILTDTDTNDGIIMIDEDIDLIVVEPSK